VWPPYELATTPVASALFTKKATDNKPVRALTTKHLRMCSSFGGLVDAYAQEQVDSWTINTASRCPVAWQDVLDGHVHGPVEDVVVGVGRRRRWLPRQPKSYGRSGRL
jgi:hypothetical protein